MAIAASRSPLEKGAHFAYGAFFDVLDLILLLARETQRRGDFRIAKCPRAALLKRNLPEPFGLVAVQNRGNYGFVGLDSFLHFLLPLVAIKTLQIAQRSSLLFDLFGDL